MWNVSGGQRASLLGDSPESAFGDGRREWYLAPFPLMSDELQVDQAPAGGMAGVARSLHSASKGERG